LTPSPPKHKRNGAHGFNTDAKTSWGWTDISEVQGHLWLQLRLDIMTESQSSYKIFHFFKPANHLHSIKNNLKFQIGSVHWSENMEVVFHVVGRPNDVPSDFMISEYFRQFKYI
jgi:hypothetical protein